MIPQATLDTINKALAEVSLTTTPNSVCADDKDVKKSLARHPDKDVIWFEFPIDVTPDKKRALMKALGKVATVTSYGLLVPTANGDAPPSADAPVDPSTPAIALPQVGEVAQPETTTETSIAEPTGVTGDALPVIEVDHSETSVTHTAAVKDAEPVRPVKTSDIKVSITPTELDKLLNDIAVTILYMWGSGSAFNVAYYRVQS